MYQMTLFLKKVIYKNNNYLINTYHFFSNFLGVACPQTPLAKGFASLSCGYVQRIALTHFRKQILTMHLS